MYCCSVAPSCLTPCDPMDCSTPGFPVLHRLPELAQTHVHWVGDAISSSAIPSSSCFLSFPASGSFPVRQLFTSGSQSYGASSSASVLPMNSQGWFPLGLMGLNSLLFKGNLCNAVPHPSSPPFSSFLFSSIQIYQGPPQYQNLCKVAKGFRPRISLHHI